MRLTRTESYSHLRKELNSFSLALSGCKYHRLHKVEVSEVSAKKSNTLEKQSSTKDRKLTDHAALSFKPMATKRAIAPKTQKRAMMESGMMRASTKAASFGAFLRVYRPPLCLPRFSLRKRTLTLQTRPITYKESIKGRNCGDLAHYNMILTYGRARVVDRGILASNHGRYHVAFSYCHD